MPRRKRRAPGEGSLYQRADGRWVAQSTWINPAGHRRIKRKVCRTESEARQQLTKLQSQRDSGTMVVPARATIGTWLTVWLENYIKPHRAPRTYITYESVLRHLPDRVRRMPLAKASELSEVFDHVFTDVRKNRGGRTAEYLRSVLSSAFNVAQKKRRIEINPIAATEAVRYQRLETSIFTVEEALRFLDSAEDHRLGAMFITMLSLGLREGEAAGLKPADVDFDSRIIHVRRSLQWVRLPGEPAGRWIERPPKRKSRRDLPMTETVYRALVRHLARRQEEAASSPGWQDGGYLFVTPTGAPLHTKNVTAAFRAICDAAGVRHLRVHDARHCCGTFLHLQGASPFVIQTVLGHTQLSTTRRYVGVPLELLRTAITGVEKLIEATRQKRDRDAAQEGAGQKHAPPRVQ